MKQSQITEDKWKINEFADDMDLNKIFEKCHNYIYANEGLLTEKIFTEILKILFIKYYDEKFCNSKNFYVTKIEQAQLKNGLDTGLQQRIFELFEEVKKKYPEFFVDANERIRLKPLTVSFVVNEFQKYNFSKTSTDVKGNAFQKFIYTHQRGSRGEFFTPTPVVKLSIELLDPTLDEKIIDPACGSASFLMEALEHIRKKMQTTSHCEIEKVLRRYIGEKVFGIDINPDLTRITKMRFILQFDGENGILTADSLLPFQEIKLAARDSNLNKELLSLQESFDILLTNPPFGSKGKITQKKILQTFKLGHKWKKNETHWAETNELSDGVQPEILFIERCLDLLNDKGRMAIVLPDGILENTSQGYIRDFINSRAKLLAVIKLPPETFIPYGTGIKASVLFLQKLKKNDLKKEQENDYKIFFGILDKIGYEGNKIGAPMYKRDTKGNFIKDDNGKAVFDEDITALLDAYSVYKSGKAIEDPQFFVRKYSELEDRWNPEFYRAKYTNLINKLKKIGAVPLSSICEIVTTRAKILKNREAAIKYVELGNIDPQSNTIVSFSKMSVFEAPSRAAFEIKTGDILTAVSGNSTGTINHASAYVSKDFEGCICSNGFRVLRIRPYSNITIDPFYLLTYLKTQAFLMQMYRLRTGAAIPAVCEKDLNRVLVYIPDSNKQTEIAENVKKAFNLKKQAIEILTKAKSDIESTL